MNAISGTRRAMKEMADGTIRVQIDIDPTCRGSFLSLFPNIDMPVALAPLAADFEAKTRISVLEQKQGLKGGELAKLAGQFCQSADFICFVVDITNRPAGPKEAADWLRDQCEVESRAQLDHDSHAAYLFHEKVRKPFLAWKEGRA